MFANERRIRIMEMLERSASVTVTELTDAFHVSLETIRRDLEYLENQGALRRVHGGAITVRKMQSYASLSSRVTEHRAEKKKLALASLPYIREDDRIALDTGSTSFELASLLCEHFHALTVLTNSLEVFRILSEKESFQTILTGGFYLPGEKSFHGYLTLDMIRQLHVSKYFLAPSAISLDFGISEHIPEMIAVQRAFIGISDQIIVQADSSKFETCAALKVCDLNPLFLYLTDSGLPDEILELYKKASLNVIKAAAFAPGAKEGKRPL